MGEARPCWRPLSPCDPKARPDNSKQLFDCLFNIEQPAKLPIILSIMPSKCPERKVLSDAVAAAVASVYRAKRAYDSAKEKNSANTEEIGIFLAAALKTEFEATTALQDHVREHGCAIDQTK